MYKSIIVLICFISFSAISVENKGDSITDQLQQILDHQLQLKVDMMTDPRMIEAKAKFARKLFDELLKQGFTEEQALIIVSGSFSVKE